MSQKKYRLGLYEKALPDFDSWEQKLNTTVAGGFDWLEISIDESDKKLSRLNRIDREAAFIINAVSATSVPVLTMCLSGHRRYPLGSRDKKVQERSLEIMERALDLSVQIGVRFIQLAGYDVYYESPGSDTEKYFRENLFRAVELAADCGVVLGFETMETPFMDTVAKSMTYVHAVQSPYLGVYPDIGNLKNAAVIYGFDVVDDLKTGCGHVLAAHLKETKPGKYRDMMFDSGGHTEYDRCIKELWSQGVRMFTAEFWYHGHADYLTPLKHTSSFLRDKIEICCS